MRVFVITGAGISAESGIPTFRGKDGYWRNLDPTKLATPEAFARDPQLVWEWYRERRDKIRAAQPNAAHEAIVKLSTLADEFLLLTQNVDDLHARAEFEGSRIPKEQIVKIHGDIFVTRCSRCGFETREHPPSSDSGVAGDQEHDQEQEQEQETQPARLPPQKKKQQEEEFATASPSSGGHKHDKVPRCPECGGMMRPGVVWFGEQLDLGRIETVERYLAGEPCDLVVVIGTTALFGYIIDWAMRARGKNGQLIEVNPDETPISSFATRLMREPAAVALPRLVSEL
jgi:NAD-dependent protein deacetylase/lipoamidase